MHSYISHITLKLKWDWDYGSLLGFSDISSLIGGIHEWNHRICYGSQALQQWTLVGTHKSIDFSVQAQCLPDMFLGEHGRRCIKNSRAITLKILRIIVNQIGNCDLCQPLTVCTGVYSESCSITLSHWFHFKEFIRFRTRDRSVSAGMSVSGFWQGISCCCWKNLRLQTAPCPRRWSTCCFAESKTLGLTITNSVASNIDALSLSSEWRVRKKPTICMF